MRLRRKGPAAAAAFGLGFGLVVAAAGQARGHFLFVKVGPMAEAGRSAEVYFSEQAEAGDPKFVDKIAGTRLWLQTTPGEFTPLAARKAADRLRAPVPTGGSLSVVGVCEYGVLARPKQTPFLLRYYPKAVAGKQEEVNAFARSGRLALEVVPTFEPGRVTLVAYREGVAIPGAVFQTVDAALNNAEVKAGADGSAAWTPPGPGRYSVYVKDVLQQPGELDGVRYDEVREFATLSFSWPLGRRDADPEAVALFEKALASRATWDDFPGFTAEAEGSVDGREFSGRVTVGPDGSVGVAVDDPVARPWLEDQIGSVVLHRLPDGGREAPVLRFADDDEGHPLGRLLAFQGGRFASSYRIKDGQITVVNRHVGKFNMSITVLGNTSSAAGGGKSVPGSYLVHYWDAVSGALERVETVTETWTRVGALDLPARHTVATSSAAGLSVREFRLSGHEAGKGR